MAFVELSATSNFTFLTGASHPEDYMKRAAELGLPALAVADENSVAGIVRAHVAAREIARSARLAAAEADRAGGVPEMPANPAGFDMAVPGISLGTSPVSASPVSAHTAAPMPMPAPTARSKTVTSNPVNPPSAPDSPAQVRPAARPPAISPHAVDAAPAPDTPQVLSTPRLLPAALIRLTDGLSVTALARDRAGWGRLCRLLSLGRLRAEKGACLLSLDDLLDWSEGLHLILHPPTPAQSVPGGAGAWLPQAQRLARLLGPASAGLMMAPAYDGQDPARFARLARLARCLGLPAVASARPLMHHAARRRLADVLTAIRLGTRVDDLGRAALANAEQRLRSEAEMLRLFRGHEAAVHRSGQIAASLTFSLDELRYEYPSEIAEGETPARRLTRLTEAGLAWRYPSGVPERVTKIVAHELALIIKLKYERYFLTVHDIVAFARGRGILCQGRGSAANSVVCYALGVTSVSPEIGAMVFERFVSEARHEPPDIDVDFEHERREEVIQHIYARYGRHRAGLCATVIHYCGKRATREVGRVMGLSEDTLSAMSGQIWGWNGGAINDARLREIGLDPADRRLLLTLELIAEIQGFPRHLSQHVGGFIITEGRLDELVPVENARMEDRTIIPWDKDDIDALGILKVDVLGLGMLSCIRKAFDLIVAHHQTSYTLATLPPEDRGVYDMLCEADSLGVFQVESRAQMNFLPRMRPRNFYDLVIQVAIIRPGPIQGDMVHPYLRRRRGEEKVVFPSDDLGRVLGKTLGVPLFQEQAMQIAIIGAGFSPEEADRLRRSLATFRKPGSVSEFRDRFMAGMAANNHDADFAARCFAQIEGFGSYGFPESHAASFALLVYASAWLKRYHPGIFACALLNSQPMGFYAPAQIVRDARQHGVTLRPVCINASFWDNVMEPDGAGGLALRLGFRQIKGLSADEADWIAAARGNGYLAVEDIWRRAGVGPRMVAALAEADAFASLGLSRRDALWAARAVTGAAPLPLFAGDIDGEGILEPAARFRAMSAGEAVVEDYVATRLTLRAHPLALLRHLLTPGMGTTTPR